MGCNGFHAMSIIFAGMSCVMILVAFETNSWMKVCIPMDNMFSGMEYPMPEQPPPPREDERSMRKPSKMDICINQGFFKVYMKAGQLYEMSIGVKLLSLPKYIIVTLIGLIISAIFSLVALVVLIVAVSGNTNSYEAKSKSGMRTGTALIILVAAGIFCVGGMLTYSGGSAHVVHQPLQFMAEFGQSLSSSFPEMFGQESYGLDGSYMNHGIKDLDLQGLGLDGSYVNREKRDIDFQGPGLDENMQFAVDAMFPGMDPVYGYSFVMGWLSFLFIVISVVLTGLARYHMVQQPYSSGPMQL